MSRIAILSAYTAVFVPAVAALLPARPARVLPSESEQLVAACFAMEADGRVQRDAWTCAKPGAWPPPGW